MRERKRWTGIITGYTQVLGRYWNVTAFTKLGRPVRESLAVRRGKRMLPRTRECCQPRHSRDLWTGNVDPFAPASATFPAGRFRTRLAPKQGRTAAAG